MLTTLGFVLSKKDVKEYDREYCFFTKKYGKINLIAKSVRKPLSKLSAQLEPPALIEIVFIPNDSKGLITTALAKKSYFKIRKGLERFKTYSQIVSTINTLTDFKQKDEALWNLLLNSVNNLNIQSAKIIEVNFLAKFLKILGFSPNIHNCINCQRKLGNQNKIYFDKEHWGFCCGECSNKNQELISWQLFKSIAILIELPLSEIIQQELNDPIELRYKDTQGLLQKYIKQIKKYF